MPTNADVASHLRAIAAALEREGANPYRIEAYRRAADAVASHPDAIAAIVARNKDDLVDLPGIGNALAAVITEVVETGTSTTLDGLQDPDRAVRALASIPALGPVRANRIHKTLGVDSLDDLAAAAEDGRLQTVPGIGPVLAARVADAVGARTDRADRPTVAELLDVDAEYRTRAEAGDLRRIAPKAHNPTGEAWLPILHTARGPRRYTALFSNTARAHELDKTRDWVVIYLDDPNRDAQWTVVTGASGALAGRRVVRGREGETRAHLAEA